MNRSRPRAACFVAMPFGAKAPPGRSSPLIQFDDVYAHILGAVETAGLEPRYKRSPDFIDLEGDGEDQDPDLRYEAPTSSLRYRWRE